MKLPAYFTRRFGRAAERGLILIGLAVASVGAAVAVLRFTRVAPLPPLVVDSASGVLTAGDSLTTRILERYTGMHVVPGNDVQLLLNGNATYPRLWHDLRAAKRTITLQSYYAIPGAVTDTLRSILLERARSGVRVLLLFDAFGSEAIPRSWYDDLRHGGIEVAELRKLEWATIHSAANRSHVRAIVIDGAVGYTGGFGFADYWLGDGLHPNQWRESNVRVEGPAVTELETAFGAAWVEATGNLLTGERFFPQGAFASPPGRSQSALFFSAPAVGNTAAERFLTILITSARRRLYITNSYFVPNGDFRRLLEAAAARGVDVRVLTTSEITDVRTTWLAGRSRYDELLSAGIRIFEYQPAMMHAKTIVVDGIWSSIGSMNFDNRSLAFNNEANLLVADSLMGATMEAAFGEDMRHSVEITRVAFDRRPWTERMLERAATLLSQVL